MTLRYRDLPAVPIAVAPVRRFWRPADARWSGLSISPGGEVHLIHVVDGAGSTILDGEGRRIELSPPDRGAFQYPLVQRFADGRWLVVESRMGDLEPNAYVFASDGTFGHAFHAGDGIETVLIDDMDRIWIGYHDEAIFGAGDYPPGHAASEFGPNVLVRLDDNGWMDFGFNNATRGREISAIYGLTIDRDNRVWLCALSNSVQAAALASVDDRTIEFALDVAPYGGAAISVGSDHFAFFGGYDHPCMVMIVERASRRLRLIQLRDEDDDPLRPAHIATRGGMAVALHDDALYRLDLDILLDALGPWDDNNSATVDSAVRYMKEEASYGPASILTLVRPGDAGVKESPRMMRPPENPPRKDDCGGS